MATKSLNLSSPGVSVSCEDSGTSWTSTTINTAKVTALSSSKHVFIEIDISSAMSGILYSKINSVKLSFKANSNRDMWAQGKVYVYQEDSAGNSTTAINGETIAHKSSTSSSHSATMSSDKWLINDEISFAIQCQNPIAANYNYYYLKDVSIVIDYEPHTHSYSSTVTKAATCTSAGSTKFTCACGDEYTDNTKPAALGHSPGPAATCTTPQTCTVCETMLVPAKGHSADAEATCTTPQTCTKCGKILAPAKGHTFTATTIKADYLKSAATCTAEAVYYRSCLRCGLSSKGQTGESTFPNGSALGHDYATTFTVDKKATCIADGSKSKHCSRCSSKTDVTVIPKRAHTIVDTTVKTEATCTTDGVMNQKCSNTATNEYEACAYTTTRAIPAKGHTEVTIPAVEPTCTATGLTAGKKCSVCGTVTVAQQTVAALGHSWNDPTYTWSADGKSCTAQRVCKTDANHKETATATITSAVKTAATCTAKGTTTYTAKFSVSWTSTQTKDVQDIAQLSHSYTGAIKSNGNGKDATHSFKCVNGCEQYGGATSHTWNDGAVTKEPTCTDKGEKTFTCTAGCGARYTKELDALGHIYNDVKTEAKPESPGYTTHTCSRCGHSYKDNYVYYITFKNGDGSDLEGVKVAEGNTPVCSKTPTKASTAEYDYTWDKSNPWTPAIGTATANQVYTPNFTATKRSYTVTFKDEGGATIKTESVKYGEKATPPTAPEKADTAQWDYSFEGWFDSNNNKWSSNTVITGNTTFTAQYSAKTQEYTVVWKNYDGTVLETDTGVLYGTKPKYDGPVPTRPNNAEHSYEFAGWDYDINAGITGNKVFTAKFEENDNGYVVRWLNADGSELEIDEWVPYGNKPDYNGETPFMDDEEFTYTFIGWRVSVTDPAQPESELEIVKGDITYTAVYDKTPKLYAITVILLNSESTTVYEYGRVVTIEAPDEEGYNFIGWSDGNTDKSRDITVLGVATYRAVYEIKTYELKLSYRATEGKITGVSQGTYNHGTSITATAVPVKGYKFSYWILTKEDGAEETIADSTIQFNITSNITIGAVFAKIPPPDITFAQILYKNKQISATNKVPADEYFRIVVAAVAYD